MKDQKQWMGYFRGINLRFSSLYSGLLSQVDVTLQQFTVLGVLDHMGPMSMTEISSQLSISKPAVTYLVDKLEAKGYLKRHQDPNDRRAYQLMIQAKGRKVVEKTQGVVLDFVVGTLNRFSAKEKDSIERFYTLLSKEIDCRIAGLNKTS